MNIQPIIELLNREKGYSLTSDYYLKIDEWRDWWKGFHKPFHEVTELAGEHAVTRRLFTLKMGKKIAEDWASLLLNEKTELVLKDRASSVFLQGEDGTGGVFGENDFWHLGNALIEKAFYSGTGAFILKLDGMAVNGESVLKSPSSKIRIEYLPAHNIIPLTVKNSRIIEAAFVSSVYEKGKRFIYLEMHELENGTYNVHNRYFDYTDGVLKEQPLPAGVLQSFNTGSDVPLFSIFSPNIVNTIPNSNGLGLSVYANAIDNLKGVDLAFNNLCRDFKLGGKKVFYNQRMIARDAKGRAIVPDDTGQQLFMLVGDPEMDDEKKLMQEYNPALRVQENKDGIQAQLDYLSFKCGFGTKHYQFNAGSIVTATQYTGDKQDLVQNASKHYIAIEKALKQLVRAILWAGKEILGQPVNPDAKVTVNFEDGFIIDKEAERQRDLQEMRDGVLQKWEFRAKWYGEDEKTAKKMVGSDLSDDDLLDFGDG